MQTMLPGEFSATWDVKGLKLSDELKSWRAHYESRHAKCPYVAQTKTRSSSSLATDSTFVQLATSSKPATLAEVQPKNVRLFSQNLSHGVWYPGLDLQLSWQGGILPRPDLPKGLMSPFVSSRGPMASQQAAALEHFTEPGPMQKWMQCAILGPSLLSTSINTFPELMERTEREDRKRGAIVIASQRSRPSWLDAQQWEKFATLRAFPLQQVPRLCAALNLLTEALGTPEVWVASASWTAMPKMVMHVWG
jgi:hypothetical protein